MTLASITPRILWSGNGSTATLSLDVSGSALTFNSTSELVVRQRIAASAEESTLVLGVDYTVTGGPILSSSASPAILTRIAGNLPSGYTWSVLRVSPSSQSLDLGQGGDFSSTDIEAALDRIVAQVQEIREQVARGYRTSEFDSAGVSTQFPTAKALNYLRWNESATRLENAATVDTTGTVVSSFMETLLDDGSAATARATLGLGNVATVTASPYALTLLDDADAATARTTLGVGSGNVTTFAGLTLLAQGGSEGAEITLTKPPSGTTLAGDVVVDIVGDDLRVFEQGGTGRGARLAIASQAGGISSSILTSTNYADTKFPCGVVAVIQDQKTQNTNGGVSSTTDVARTLNVLTYNKNSAVSLANGTTGVGGTANQFVLPAGTWRIDWRAPAYNSGAHRSIIHNVTDNVTVGIGSNGFSDQNATSDPSQSDSIGTCVFTIAGTKTFELRHSTRTAYGGGDGWGFGSNKGVEVYSQVVISAAA